ncbi:MAG TPA: transporter associated domain-containing protein, partial [Coleofasciculaceae cyanobacterium]
IQAQMGLEHVNELLTLNLPLTDEYQTLGGFLLYEFQKLPVPGETLIYQNLELTVLSTQGPRLHQIRIHRHEVTAESLEDKSHSSIKSVITKTKETQRENSSTEFQDASSQSLDGGIESEPSSHPEIL